MIFYYFFVLIEFLFDFQDKIWYKYKNNRWTWVYH